MTHESDPAPTPLPEAYSRVSNPERFGALHDCAARLLDRLEREFHVHRVDDYGPDELFDQEKLVRPTVQLSPFNGDAAPIAIAFTAFPGLMLRIGNWTTKRFRNVAAMAARRLQRKK